jgi:hypothetical protein
MGMVVDVSVASMHLHLEVSDYVQVHVRGDTRKHGGVIYVEQDIVMFIDDMSIKTGQPEQVGF